MHDGKRKKLEAKGWEVGNTADFLELSPTESALVELKEHHRSNPMLLLIRTTQSSHNVEVSNLLEATTVWAKYRDENVIGSRDMLKACGLVISNNKIEYRVSYNGRVWHASKTMLGYSTSQIELAQEYLESITE